jgi:hypothetical protein
MSQGQGTATSGDKGAHGVSPKGTSRATRFTPELRSEQGNTDGLTGAGNAKEIPVPQNQDTPKPSEIRTEVTIKL